MHVVFSIFREISEDQLLPSPFIEDDKSHLQRHLFAVMNCTNINVEDAFSEPYFMFA